MFLNQVGKPTKIKKIVYLFASIFLGFLLSLIFHSLVEISYLHQAMEHRQIIAFYGSCALPPIIQSAIWLSGIIGGYLFGNFWWRKIYLERCINKVKK